MCPLKKYPFLQSLLSSFRLPQQKTLALIIGSIAEVAQANSLQIASHLASELEIQLGSALNRFYRLLRNPRIDDQKLTSQLIRLMADGKQSLLIAIDWTQWHQPWQMLIASVVLGCRAIPLQSTVCSKPIREKSQNTKENVFLESLVSTLKELGVGATFLCDRGLRRVAWIKLLVELEQHFVVRLMTDVMIHKRGGVCRRLSSWHLGMGQAVDLGWVWLRQDRAVRARIIGLWAPGQKEAWWLVTDLDDSLVEIAVLYDRRMAIEQQIRDTKGYRFGVKLIWTQFQNPQYLSRFVLLVAVALVMWTAIGQAVSEQDPRVRLVCKSKGPRLSLMRVGISFLVKISGMVHIGIKFLRTHLPPPALRIFGWIQIAKNKFSSE